MKIIRIMRFLGLKISLNIRTRGTVLLYVPLLPVFGVLNAVSLNAAAFSLVSVDRTRPTVEPTAKLNYCRENPIQTKATSHAH